MAEISCPGCGEPTTRTLCVKCTRHQISQAPLVTGFRRARARAARLKRYPEWCDTHGEVEHFTDTGRCAVCAPQFQRGNPLRVAARHAGDATYPAHCETHGRTGFHTNVGKCATCFNAMGTPRPVGGRRAGAPETAERQTVITRALLRVSPSISDWAAQQMRQGANRGDLRRALKAAADVVKRPRREY